MSQSEMSGSKNDNEDNEEEEEEDEDAVIKGKDMIFQPLSLQRKWLKQRGKDDCIDFQEDERRLLKEYFESLDEDGGGSIGVDELEDPLIALGLVDNR